jgi:hypothetical protein
MKCVRCGTGLLCPTILVDAEGQLPAMKCLRCGVAASYSPLPRWIMQDLMRLLTELGFYISARRDRSSALLRRLFAYASDVLKQSGIRWCAAIYQTFERLDTCIQQTESSIIVTDHGVDAPVARILHFSKTGPSSG